VPYAIVEHEPAELCQIPCTQLQPAGRVRVAVWEPLPPPPLYRKRLEERVFGQLIERPSRNPFQYEAQQPDAATVVVPHTPRRRFHRAPQHGPVWIGGDPCLPHDVCRVVDRNGSLGPIETRASTQQMTQRNAVILGGAEIVEIRKEREDRGIEILEPTTVEGDADVFSARPGGAFYSNIGA